MNDIHIYETNLLWNFERNGTLSSPNLPTKIEVTTPPEFSKGQKDIWTPEHLFVASVNSCIMATFLLIAENSDVEFNSYTSKAIGEASKVDGKYMFTEITITPTIVIPSSQHIDKVKRVLELSEKACTISNSISSKITILPFISVE